MSGGGWERALGQTRSGAGATVGPQLGRAAARRNGPELGRSSALCARELKQEHRRGRESARGSAEAAEPAIARARVARKWAALQLVGWLGCGGEARWAGVGRADEAAARASAGARLREMGRGWGRGAGPARGIGVYFLLFLYLSLFSI